MSPRKQPKLLYNLSLEKVTRNLKNYMKKKLEKQNLFIDYEGVSSFEIFSRKCKDGIDFINENIVGTIR